MKIEVLCKICGQGILVDDSSLRGAGEVPCVHCGAMIHADDVVAAGAAPGPAREEEPVEAAGDHETRETGSGEVVCPRCGLHFLPRRGRDEARPGARRTVLVVEDMEYFLEIAKDSLSERYDVRTATTVDEALRILRGGRIDALVMDLTLGGREIGIQVLETVQPKPCPILVFTAEDEADTYGENWERLKSLGADDLVRKEMNMGETLLRKVASLLGDPLDQDE